MNDKLGRVRRPKILTNRYLSYRYLFMTTKEIQEYEDAAQNIAERSRENLDNALLKICSLGIPITILFMDRVAFAKGEYQWLFGLFLVSWMMTLICVIISFKTSERGWFQFDFSKIKDDEEIKLKSTECLNNLSLAFFLIGLACLIGYSAANHHLF